MTEEEIFAKIAAGEMTGELCVEIVNGPGDEYGPITAPDLLHLAFGGKIETRFKRLNNTMVTLLADVKKVFPDAQYYTASGGFHLMIGPSHDDHQSGQQELVALGGKASVGDGDF